MYKNFSILLLVMLSFNSLACDVCGCSSSTANFGILPSLSKHFVGVKYQYTGFQSKPHDVNDIHYGPSDEHFQSIELWARTIIKKRFQVFTVIPYNFNSRNEVRSNTSLHGIGDATVLLSYVILQPSTEDKNWYHSLQAGAGIKLPTGKYNQLKNNLLLHQNIQLGTGSFDFPININYTVRYKLMGFNSELNYRLNRLNKMGYQFGNRFQASSRLFVQRELKKITLIPNLGFQYEFANQDLRNTIPEDYTGGSLGFLNAGIDTYYKKMGLSFTFQHPVLSHFGEGHITSNPRFSSRIILLF